MLKQFIKFVIVGFVNTGIDLGVFWLLYEMGVQYHLAACVSFLLAVANSYYWNRKWTFKSKVTKVHSEFTKFFIVNIVSFTVMQAGLTLLVENYEMYPPLAKAFVTILVLIINFTGNKLWTFKSPKSRNTTPLNPEP